MTSKLLSAYCFCTLLATKHFLDNILVGAKLKMYCSPLWQKASLSGCWRPKYLQEGCHSLDVFLPSTTHCEGSEC